MEYYLLGQDLWEIIDGENLTPPTDAREFLKWKIKADKPM